MKFSRWLNEVTRSIRFMARKGSSKLWPQRALLVIGFLATAGTSLHAQLVSDSVTHTLANVTNAITGTVTVGTNGSFAPLRQPFC